MRFFAVWIAALALAGAASGQQASATKKTANASALKPKAVSHPSVTAPKAGAKAASKSGSQNSAPAAAASKPLVSKTGAKTSSKAGAKTRKTVVARRPPTQQQPTTDRYKEIQQALMDKGYFQGPVDGAWNVGSVEALKRFQKDQNLDPDGKIGSLSLIALGLGPKRSAASASAPAVMDPVDPPPVAQPQQ